MAFSSLLRPLRRFEEFVLWGLTIILGEIVEISIIWPLLGSKLLKTIFLIRLVVDFAVGSTGIVDTRPNAVALGDFS